VGIIRGSAKWMPSHIRINSVAPGYTESNILTESARKALESVGHIGQSSEYPATAVLYLHQKKSENGQTIYSDAGKFWDLERNIVGCSEYIFGPSTDECSSEYSDEQLSKAREALKIVI